VLKGAVLVDLVLIQILREPRVDDVRRTVLTAIDVDPAQTSTDGTAENPIPTPCCTDNENPTKPRDDAVKQFKKHGRVSSKHTEESISPVTDLYIDIYD